MKFQILPILLLLGFISPSFSQQESLESIKQFRREILNGSKEEASSTRSNPTANFRGDEYGNPPSWGWISDIGGDGVDQIKKIVEDSQGNWYVLGTFSGPVNFALTDLQSQGYFDTFLAKLSSTGNLLWIKSFAASSKQRLIGYSIALDTSNQIYLTGSFTGSTNAFGALLEAQGTAAFVAKLDTDGNVTWAKKYETSILGNYHAGTQIAVDQNGIVYALVARSFSAAILDGIFVKYSASGQFLSETDFGGVSINDFDLKEDQLFLTGNIKYDIDLGGVYLNPVSPYGNAFVARTNLNMEFDWIEMLSSSNSGDSYGTSIVAGDNGNCFISGIFRGDCITGAIASDNLPQGSYCTKVDMDGNFVWTNFVQSPGTSFGNLSPDKNGDLLASAPFYASVQLDNGMTVENPWSLNHLFVINGANGQYKKVLPQDWQINDLAASSTNDYLLVGSDGGDLLLESYNAALQSKWVWKGNGKSGGAILNTERIGLERNGKLYMAGEYIGALKMGLNDLYSAKPAVVLARLNDSGGDVSWAKDLKTEEGSVTMDALGVGNGDNIAIGGFFTGTLQTSVGNFTGKNQPYLTQYYGNGSMKWLKPLGGDIRINSLKFDSKGNLLTSGNFSGEIQIENTTLGDPNDTHLETFLAKWNKDGNLLWAKQGQGEDFEYTSVISLDANDNIYLSVEVNSFDYSFGGQSLHLEEGDGNVVVAKLNADGETQWMKAYGGSADLNTNPFGDYFCWPQAIQNDEAGNIFVMGWFGSDNYIGNTRFASPFWEGGSNYRYNWFVMKLDPQGEVLWGQTVNERRLDWPAYNIGSDRRQDNLLGNCYIGGSIRDTVWLDNQSIAIAPEVGKRKNILIEYGIDGQLKWVKTMSGDDIRLSDFEVPGVEKIAFIGSVLGDATVESPHDYSTSNRHFLVGAVPGGLVSGTEDWKVEAIGWEVTPNPFDGQLQVRFALDQAREVRLTLLDVSGREVATQSLGRMRAGDQSYDWNIKSLPTGSYLLQLQTGDLISVKKLEKI